MDIMKAIRLVWLFSVGMFVSHCYAMTQQFQKSKTKSLLTEAIMSNYKARHGLTQQASGAQVGQSVGTLNKSTTCQACDQRKKFMCDYAQQMSEARRFIAETSLKEDRKLEGRSRRS